MTTHTSGERIRYRSGFFARYVRGFVLAKMDAEGWRQHHVADWVGIPDYALSEYLNRHTHPTPERRMLLEQLGCDEQELIEAELLDKLECWMDNHSMRPEEVRNGLHQIQAYRYQVEQARARGRRPRAPESHRSA